MLTAGPGAIYFHHQGLVFVIGEGEDKVKSKQNEKGESQATAEEGDFGTYVSSFGFLAVAWGFIEKRRMCFSCSTTHRKCQCCKFRKNF